MTTCTNVEVRKLGSTRNFLQIPDAKTCGRRTLYYGKDCQHMEIDGVTREVRAASSPIRTWNRYRQEYCTIGNQESPPDIQTLTIRFYEPCDEGIPLSHTLGLCRVRAVINHGLCRTPADATDFSYYSEVYDLNILSEARGRRTSYDGADDVLTNEITAELINLYDVGPMYFTPIDLQNDACATGTVTADNAAFGCTVGCGGTSCGCNHPCDDGTQTIYVPAACDGGTGSQYLLTYTSGGDEFMATYLLPSPSSGSVTPYPKLTVVGNRIYMLAYEMPASLWYIDLDERGVPTGPWTEVATLVNDTDTATIPAAISSENGVVHVLVSAATGAQYFSYGDNISPTSGPRRVFPATANVRNMSTCGSTIAVVGDDGYMEVSLNEGGAWSLVTTPTTEDLFAVEVSDTTWWIGGTNNQRWYSTDQGANWTRSYLPGSTGTVSDIAFAGEDIGWTVNQVLKPFSTWLGGVNDSEWVNRDSRIVNFPDNVLPTKVILPECASGHLLSNTALIFGKQGGLTGPDVLYVGRGKVSGY